MRMLAVILILLLTTPALAGEEDYELGFDSMERNSSARSIA